MGSPGRKIPTSIDYTGRREWVGGRLWQVLNHLRIRPWSDEFVKVWLRFRADGLASGLLAFT